MTWKFLPQHVAILQFLSLLSQDSSIHSIYVLFYVKNMYTRRKSQTNISIDIYKARKLGQKQNYLSLEGALLYADDVDFFAFVSIERLCWIKIEARLRVMHFYGLGSFQIKT